MTTIQWIHEKIGEGRYAVRIGTDRIPGIILGGNGRWVVQIGGDQLQGTFKTLRKAASEIVSRHFD